MYEHAKAVAQGHHGNRVVMLRYICCALKDNDESDFFDNNTIYLLRNSIIKSSATSKYFHNHRQVLSVSIDVCFACNKKAHVENLYLIC